MLTRCKKHFDGEVAVSPASTAIERIFSGAEYGGEDYIAHIHVRWIRVEEDLCFKYVEEKLEQDSSITLWSLVTGASYFMNSFNYYRTANAIYAHLRSAVSASKAQSSKTHDLPLVSKALCSEG
ncbi:unnamed protein product [Fusarium venenatum]|uniref:Uncharacterized protein n=1 Tax=Fusarium venenatum TaxID=56646 RepID=A0A2L2TKD9_9HYPO|nr:uncharacterized protein FVRRES_08620 [Fusarium venenatum]CEI68543.1 unnamed protein product [Fusarium venenatum]